MGVPLRRVEMVEIPTDSVERDQLRALVQIERLEVRCAHRRETMRYLGWAKSRLAEDPGDAPRVLMVLEDIRQELRGPSPPDYLQRFNR